MKPNRATLVLIVVLITLVFAAAWGGFGYFWAARWDIPNEQLTGGQGWFLATQSGFLGLVFVVGYVVILDHVDGKRTETSYYVFFGILGAFFGICLGMPSYLSDGFIGVSVGAVLGLIAGSMIAAGLFEKPGWAYVAQRPEEHQEISSGYAGFLCGLKWQRIGKDSALNWTNAENREAVIDGVVEALTRLHRDQIVQLNLGRSSNDLLPSARLLAENPASSAQLNPPFHASAKICIKNPQQRSHRQRAVSRCF